MTETVGQRLKRLRLERGISQRDLACDGASYAYISRIEAGTRTPSVKALRLLAARLDVSVEYLETGHDVLCVAVAIEEADAAFRDATRVSDGTAFGLSELDERERGILDVELHGALLKAVQGAGFGLRALRDMGATHA